jgi:Sugar (and other) transporter
MSWQLFDAVGVLLGFTVNLTILGKWRVLLASAAVPAFSLLLLVFVCTESPRFLIKRNRYCEAYESLNRLRETPLQACRGEPSLPGSVAGRQRVSLTKLSRSI